MLAFRKLPIFNIRRHFGIYIDQFNISETGIPIEEFRQRRDNVVEAVRNNLKRNGLEGKSFTLCLPSAIRSFMGPDVVYFPFKQEPDFYYLTGCLQPDAYFLIEADEKRYSTHLYLSPCTAATIKDYERWSGPVITDQTKMCDLFQIDSVESVENFPSSKKQSSNIVYINRKYFERASVMQKYLLDFLNKFSTKFGHLNILIEHFRSIKSINEQNILRQVCQRTSQAFRSTMKTPSSIINNEAMIKARFQFECEKSGDMSLSFYPVVAASDRPNIIHYQKNNKAVEKNDLIMLDGGAMLQQYCSDITRLWPINGRFTAAQRQLYEIVLAVQKHLIDQVNVSQRSIPRTALNSMSNNCMLKYLREEHIIPQATDDTKAMWIVKQLCPTGVSHNLGLDIHDCEAIEYQQTLVPGNVITIEPGLYIPSDFIEIPLAYRGFATRIEDDILVTENGCEILTEDCPKEVGDIYRALDERKL